MTGRGIAVPGDISSAAFFLVAAAVAEGTTVIADAKELRVKESDRIATVSRFLRDMGAEVEEREDGMVIHGGHALHGAEVESHGDHRVAMSAAVAALAAGVENRIHGAESIATSFPSFTALMQELGAEIA
jgi:3-phosphoshikimate 1-carboxyvinyltransferase